MDAYIDRNYYASGGHVDGAVYYFRIVRRDDGKIWNTSTEAFADNTSWANSVVAMTEKGTTGAFPVIIPADFPPGTFDIIIYNQLGGSPENTDDVATQYQTKVGDIMGF